MITVNYIDRQPINRFTCIDTEKTLKALSMFVQGGLTYFKIDRFNYEVIDTYFIKSIISE